MGAMNIGFYERIVSEEAAGRTLWIATVVRVEGSAPASVGMKLLASPDGLVAGTIGGGDIERRVLERIALERPASPECWSYDLGDLGGNGSHDSATAMICGGRQEILIEPIANEAPLYIIGGGHCGMALSELAARCGFAVTVLDNRAEWASNVRHPSARRCVCAPYGDVAKHVGQSDRAFVVIMTHGHAHDELVLSELIGRPFRYLGMIGSAGKVRTVLEHLMSDGVPRESVVRVYSPVGLEIGSHTPYEIAVSICAQMIAVRNRRDGSFRNSNPLAAG
jgi:xanthine dehydrogenase accessory factor